MEGDFLGQLSYLVLEPSGNGDSGIAVILESYGLDVVPVEEEDAIIRHAQGKKRFAVLMDFQHPAFDCVALARRVKALDEDIPVIAVTDFADHELLASIAQLNLAYVLSKPVNEDRLLIEVSKVGEQLYSGFLRQQMFIEEQAIGRLLEFSLEQTEMRPYLEKSLEYLCHSVPWLHLLPKAGVFLAEDGPRGKSLCLKANHNFSPILEAVCRKVAFGHCMCGRAAAAGEVQFADCVDERHETRPQDMTPHGHYNIPILHGGEVAGVLVCYLPHGHPRVEREQAFLERVAKVLSMGIFQRQQSMSLRQAKQEANRFAEQIDAITRNLSGIIFRRIDYPGGHVEYPYISSSNRKLARFPSRLVENGILEGCEMVHPDDREAVMDALRPALMEPKPMAHDFRLVMDDGKMHWVHCTAFPTVLESGAVCWDGLLLDIDDRKSLEAQLAQSQKLEAVGQLAAGIAHEINTPTQYVSDNMHFIKDAFEDIMRLVQACGEFAHGRRLTGEKLADIRHLEKEIDLAYLREEVPAAIEQAQEGLQSIAGIIGAMKQFSHPGTDEMGSVDINMLLRNTVTISRNEWKYVAKVEMELSPDAGHITGYSNQLGQVFLNLIVNAAHAIAGIGSEKLDREGRIYISSRMDGDFLEIRFADNGPGIPREIREKVFNPFFTTKDVGKGTGQGLAIAYDIVVNKHKGSLRLRPSNDGGAEFVIRLPVEQRQAVSVGSHESRREAVQA